MLRTSRQKEGLLCRNRDFVRFSFPVVFGLTAIIALADDWPQWRGPDRTGVSAETNWCATWPPVERWRTNVGQGFSSVAVSEGRLYTLGWSNNQDWVWCLDAVTGGVIWSYAYTCVAGKDGNGPRSTPTVDGGQVYTFSQAGDLYCFDKVSGSVQWNRKVALNPPSGGWGFAGSPLIEGDRIILNASGGGVAVQKDGNHDVLWSNLTGTAAYSSPHAFTWNAQRIVTFFTQHRVVGVRPADGSVVWSASWDTDYDVNAADPIVYGNQLFISTGYAASAGGTNTGSALLNLASGTLARAWWSTSNLKTRCSPAVLCGDYFYGVDQGGTLRCIAASDGSVRWQQTGFGEGSLIAAGGKLIVLSYDGRLTVADVSPSGYSTGGRATIDTGVGTSETRTIPVLANGRIYCRGYNGTVVCYDVGHTPDRDLDGISDNWETQYFVTNTLCSPTVDADDDSLNNLQEFIAGTNPTNRQSSLAMTVTLSNGYVVVSCPTVQAAGATYTNWTRYYTLECSTNLVDKTWAAVPLCSNMPGNNSVLCYTNQATDVPMFYRVKVRLR